MPSRKYQIVFTLFISFFISLLANVLFPVINGQSITLQGWVMGVLICTITSLVFCTIIPVGRFGAWFAMQFGASPDSTAGKLLIDVLLAAIILVVLTIAMTIFNTGMGELGGTTLLDRIAGGVLGGFGMIVVVTVFCDPIAAVVTRKIVRD